MSLQRFDVFSVAEIARAAGATVPEVWSLDRSGDVPLHPGGFAAPPDAVRAIRMLRQGRSPRARWQMFSGAGASDARPGVRFAAATAVHGAILGGLILWSTLGPAFPAPAAPVELNPVRLVFLSLPGPGGGGGGGGTKQPAPASRARLRDMKPLRSPVLAATARRDTVSERPANPQQTSIRTEPAEPQPEPPPAPIPAIVAPVVAAAADPQTVPGSVTAEAPERPSQGSGQGGGSGTGEGAGLGEGTGPGIGPGSGGGTGGGPFRPGSGITPPQLLHEVRPDYTEDARRRGLSGEVVLEIVVRSDGGVGAIRLVRGLGAGLDQRAVDAVRQWRFSPARRHGAPVDVMVEVAVEFRLR